MNATEFADRVEKALGPYRVSDWNPCGGTGYVDAGESLPYRVLYCDGADCMSFASASEAIADAAAYCAERESESA